MPVLGEDRRGARRAARARSRARSPTRRPSDRRRACCGCRIDRVFSMKGFGTVVTGTLWAGTVAAGGRRVGAARARGPGQVRGVQVHGAPSPRRARGSAPRSTSPCRASSWTRGERCWCARASSRRASSLDVRLRYLPTSRGPLKRRSAARRSCSRRHGAGAGAARLLDPPELEPGRDGLAQLRLEAPMARFPAIASSCAGRGHCPAAGRRSPGDGCSPSARPRRRRGAAELLAPMRSEDLDARPRSGSRDSPGTGG